HRQRVQLVGLGRAVVLAAVDQSGFAEPLVAPQRAADRRGAAGPPAGDPLAAVTLLRPQHDPVTGAGVGVTAAPRVAFELRARARVQYDPSCFHCLASLPASLARGPRVKWMPVLFDVSDSRAPISAS